MDGIAVSFIDKLKPVTSAAEYGKVDQDFKSKVYTQLGNAVYKLASENINVVMSGVVPADVVLKYAKKAQKNVYIFVIREENPYKVAKFLNSIHKKRIEGSLPYDEDPLKAELQRYFRDRIRAEYPLTIDSAKNVVEYFKRMGKIKYFNYDTLDSIVDTVKEVTSRNNNKK